MNDRSDKTRAGSKLPDSSLPNNGVAIHKRTLQNPGYRTYEVHQRERVGQSTEKIQPIKLISADQLTDPFNNLATLREHYPCYRDWLGNAYWLTRYDDVTSVFSDRANFHVPTRAEQCGLPASAKDLGTSITAHSYWGALIDDRLPQIITQALDNLADKGPAADVCLDYALRITNELLRIAFGVPAASTDWLAATMWHIQRADSCDVRIAQQGTSAITALIAELDRIQQLGNPADSLAAALVAPESQTTEPISSVDLLATVLGFETRTLHGGIANLSHAWLTDSAVRAAVTVPSSIPDSAVTTGASQGLKIACLESLRHTPTVAFVNCYARHEVERFGRLLPEGALVRLSAIAANRDPRQFADAELFKANRQDICHREARGQFRADGLATGLTLGMGLPSKHPAIPEDRPRSFYALTRDAIIAANAALLDRYPEITLQAGADTRPRSLGIFEAFVAWTLPVTLAP